MNLNKFWILSLFLMGLVGSSYAQNSWIYFSDKCSAYDDYFNAPVCTEYIESVQSLSIKIIGTSRWLNAACIANSDVHKINNQPYIRRIEAIQTYAVVEDKIDEDFGYGLSDIQIQMMNLDEYHRLGNTGQNIKLAIFDGGFWQVDSLPIFASMWANNQIIATRDFVNNDSLTYNESTHGMQVLALAGINYPDSMVGAAPGADFILARTEDTRSEKHIEELNWLRAMEWADSMHVDIIHSSLGYSLFDTLQGDYSYQDMDGNSTLITLAAQNAAQRGIFVTNSAGNSGEQPWYYITAPCDGKDVLCVGAVDSFRQIGGFSSRGPSADGRIKPDVSAMGVRNTIPNTYGILGRGSGTSFSGPLVAGLVTCLKGAHPLKTNTQIFEAVLLSSDRYFEPDNEYGHGIPNAIVADSILTAMPVLSVSTYKLIEVAIYPNPATSYLKIKCNPGSTISIQNAIGKQVVKDNLENWINFVDVKNLSQGAYTVTISYLGHRAIKKVIIN